MTARRDAAMLKLDNKRLHRQCADQEGAIALLRSKVQTCELYPTCFSLSLSAVIVSILCFMWLDCVCIPFFFWLWYDNDTQLNLKSLLFENKWLMHYLHEKKKKKPKKFHLRSPLSNSNEILRWSSIGDCCFVFYFENMYLSTIYLCLPFLSFLLLLCSLYQLY